MRRLVYYRLLFLSLFLGIVACIVMPAHGETIANFDGGGSLADPVTDVVDAYPGMDGGGWDAGWNTYTNHSTYSIDTIDTTPLGTGTGNYLDVAMTPTASSGTGRYASLSRSYAAGIDVALSHSIDFSLRVNEDTVNGTFTTSTDRYQLFDAPVYAQGTAGTNCSWILGCYGGSATWLDASKVGHWVVFNGDNNLTSFTDERNLDTGITVSQGTVYDFHIDIDAESKTWDVTIGSGGTTLYDSTTNNPDGLGWRNADATVAGLPHFSTYGDTTADTRAYSLDSLRITQVPEPSTLVLILTLSLIGLIRRRSR
jgi:hypothetical protein